MCKKIILPWACISADIIRAADEQKPTESADKQATDGCCFGQSY